MYTRATSYNGNIIFHVWTVTYMYAAKKLAAITGTLSGQNTLL